MLKDPIKLLPQVLALVKAAAPDLRSARAWRTLCALIANMSLHPEAAPVALEALAAAAAPEALSTLSFIPVLEVASQLVERNSAVGPLLNLGVRVQYSGSTPEGR